MKAYLEINNLNNTGAIDSLRRTELDMFYIAPTHKASAAAKNTSSQLTYDELLDLHARIGRVGLRLESSSYNMIELLHPHYDANSLASVALLPEPAIQFWSPEFDCISSLYFCDALIPNMQLKDSNGKTWLKVNGSYDNRFAYTILPGGTSRRKFFNAQPAENLQSTCITHKDLEFRLKCAAFVELGKWEFGDGSPAAQLMEYLAANNVDFSIAFDILKTIALWRWRQTLDEGFYREEYRRVQQWMDVETAYFHIHGNNCKKMVDTLNSWLGFTAPVLLPDLPSEC